MQAGIKIVGRNINNLRYEDDTTLMAESKGKGVCQGCILSPCLFDLYAECIMLGWKKYKLESGLPGEISITSDMQMKPPYGKKQKRTKERPDESERGE